MKTTSSKIGTYRIDTIEKCSKYNLKSKVPKYALRNTRETFTDLITKYAKR